MEIFYLAFLNVSISPWLGLGFLREVKYVVLHKQLRYKNG